MYSEYSQTNSVSNEKLLEFHLLLGRVLKKKNRVYKFTNNQFTFTINAKGDKFNGEVYFKPFDSNSFGMVTVEFNEKLDRIRGRFTPFYIVQEEAVTDVNSCGNDAENSLLLFLSLNLQFTKLLDSDTSKHLLEILKRGIIKIQNECD